MSKVLLTGGSGFIAAHCLEQLLQQGYSVVTTVRSEDKADKIRQAHKDASDRLQVVIVPDIAQKGAFDEVVKTPGLDVVMHTASPFHYSFTDPQKEIIDPALQGTTSLLQAIKTSAPSVHRVIVTSSFAAMLDEAGLHDPNTTFTEKSWNPVAMKNLHDSKSAAYRLSKTLAERACWDFVANEKPNFDVVSVNPPLVLGPVVHHMATFDNINTSNSQMVNFLQGKYKTGYPELPVIDAWVDVRDLAKAHVLAMQKKDAGGHRLFVVADRYNYRDWVKTIKQHFPEYKDRLPGDDMSGGTQSVDNFKIDNSETNKVLGLKYLPLEQTVVDLVQSLKDRGI